MIAASLIASIAKEGLTTLEDADSDEGDDFVQGVAAENEQYLNG